MSPKPPNRRTSARHIQAMDRTERALELRIAGKSLRYIATMLGISHQSVHELIQRAMSVKIDQPAAELRRLEVERLDAIFDALFEQRGHPETARTLVKVMERRAKLLGLDAPTKTEITGILENPILDRESVRRMAEEVVARGSDPIAH
jgi:hypothetical protein